MDLIQILVDQLGVDKSQASGGAGLLLNLAKEKLGDGDFSQISNMIPDVGNLLSSAPKAGGLGSMIGGVASALGGEKTGGLADLASLAGGFSKLNLDSGMIAKFIPVILSFVSSKGGSQVKNILESALK
jgi:Protein of unknown function VcgC/VcgE (DUF2780)